MCFGSHFALTLKLWEFSEPSEITRAHLKTWCSTRRLLSVLAWRTTVELQRIVLHTCAEFLTNICSTHMDICETSHRLYLNSASQRPRLSRRICSVCKLVLIGSTRYVVVASEKAASSRRCVSSSSESASHSKFDPPHLVGLSDVLRWGS